MNDARFQSPGHSARPRGGFTLTEVLIVIALMLLVITLAIPAFSVITGGRSVDAAQNQISAALARARQDAMGLQEPRGIIFFPDVNTGRVVVAEVYYPGYRDRNTVLDLLPEREALELPVGVGCQVMPRYNGSAPTTADPAPFPSVGVIMFDGLGRVESRQWHIQATTPANKDDANYNALRARIDQTPDNPSGLPPGFPPLGTAVAPHDTQMGVLLFDRIAYDERPDDDARFTWLNDNATPVLLNRYNGSILPAR